MRIITGMEASRIERGVMVFPRIADNGDGGVVGLGDRAVPFPQARLHFGRVGAFAVCAAQAL